MSRSEFVLFWAAIDLSVETQDERWPLEHVRTGYDHERDQPIGYMSRCRLLRSVVLGEELTV